MWPNQQTPGITACPLALEGVRILWYYSELIGLEGQLFVTARALKTHNVMTKLTG